MSTTITIQPPDVKTLTITSQSPLSIQVEDVVAYPVEITPSGTFLAPAYYVGVSQVLGTTNQVDVSTVANIATISLPMTINAPNDVNVGGDLVVSQTATFNGATTITAGQTFTADVGGDLQGTLPNPTVHRIKNIDIHNSPDNLDLFQYKTSNNKYHWVTFAEAGVAAASHTHSGADITSGTIGFSYLPTGTGSSQVAIGNHTHTMADITDLREQKIFVESECNAAGEFSTISSNSGLNSFTGTGIDTTGGHYGVLTSTTSTTNNAVAGIGSADTTTATIFGTFKVETTAIIMFPQLSTSSERFFIESGWTDNRTGTPTDGVLIQYCDNVNSGKFIGLAYNNSSLSQVDLGITAAANTWYKFNIVVNTNGSVDFYIDGVLKGQLGSGSAPTTSSRATSLSHTIRKSVGTTSRGVYIDYINYIVWCSR